MIRAIALVAALAACTPLVTAQTPELTVRTPELIGCAPVDTILAGLEAQYGERPVSAGLNGNGLLLVITVSDDSQTWTILLQAPDDTACLIAAGEGWRPIEVKGPEL
jgi:hypothetical protein